jgi:hypothetical protein
MGARAGGGGDLSRGVSGTLGSATGHSGGAACSIAGPS